MDFKKTGATAIAIGFVGGALLLGGVMLGSSSGRASSQAVGPKTQMPATATAYIPDDSYLLATATPEGGNKGTGGTLVPVNQPDAGSGNDGGGEQPAPVQPQPQPEQPQVLEPDPEPQPPVIEPEPESEPKAEDEGDVLQLAPPTVTATTPGHNSTGNTRGTNIQFKFNQVMDKASVNAAFAMLSPVVDGTISWDETGKVMTFNPAADFTYGQWVEAKIGQGVKDKYGGTMGNDMILKFRVMRIATIDLYSVAGKDGYVTNPQVAAISYVNTSANRIKVNTWERGFLSFNLGSLPENVIDVTDAELSVLQSSADATSFGGVTGNLRVQPLVYGNLDISDFNKKGPEVCWPLCAPISQVLSTSQGLGVKSADVTLFVRADVKNRAELGDLSQFRLFFDKENDGDGPKVGVEIHAGEGATKPTLRVTYTYH